MSSPASQVLVYVDGNYGSDSNTGVLDSPYLTLSKALQEVKNGGIITLQTGNYSLNGYGSIDKNVSIIGANGAFPVLNDEFNFINAQGLLKNLRFVDQSTVIVNNSGFGGFEIKSCDFDDPDYPIQIESSNYVSIHQNRFYNYLEAIKVSSCRELVVSANYFYSDTAINGRAIYASNVEWLDVYHNTIYGAHSIGGDLVGDLNLRVLYISMTSTILSQKKVSLPSFSSANDYGYDVAINIVNGPTQEYGKDYTVTDSGITISWSGLGLDGNLRLSDTIRVMYSEAPSLVTGEAISAINVGNSNSRVDSNNITDASVGVYFTDNLRVRFNNFDSTTIFINGTPTDGGITGCITGAPGYVGSSLGNFNLEADSPDIDNADPERWETILREMGIGRIPGMDGYTGISLPTGRPGISPFNRNYDKSGLERLSRSDRDDIGAYEYPSTGTNPEADSYIAEYGFDHINPGSITGPFATIDRGFSGIKDPQVVTNALGQLVLNPDGTHVGITGISIGATGYQYGRFVNRNLDMFDLSLMIGAHNKESIAFVQSALPSNTPTGVYVGPPVSTISGDTGSSTNPYRTIDDAISGTPYATTVYVKPGIYPTFNGSSGKKLVGLHELSYMSLNTNKYMRFDTNGWTGSGEALLLGSSLLFDVGLGLTGRTESVFQMSGNIDVRFDWFIDTDVIEIRFYNDSNYVSISKLSGKIVIKHYTGGVSYTSMVDSGDSAYKLFFSLVGSSAIVKITGSTTSINKSISLVSDYGDPWKMSVTYRNYGNYTGGVSKIIANADSFTGAFGITGTSMSRKVFGVVGESTMTGLDPWYGTYGISGAPGA